MSEKPKIIHCRNIRKLVERLRDDLNSQEFVLLYAYNGTGKTRLSMEFKEAGKRKRGIARDTLYFNAYTEDLFHWDNDLENNAERVLQINSNSKFFDGFKELALENKIFSYLERYAKDPVKNNIPN
jgi:tRNA A37 threonylcarbamoyladenosine biosynthesis protein TsaE